MRASWFLILALGQLAHVCPVGADEPEWVEKSFRPESAEYVYTVGVGIGSDELSALREARRHALASFIQAHLARNARVAVRTIEGNSGVMVDDRTSSEVYRLDLTQFEKIDQRVVSQELPIQQFKVKSLYRFPRSLLAKYRESVRRLRASVAQFKEFKRTWEGKFAATSLRAAERIEGVSQDAAKKMREQAEKLKTKGVEAFGDSAVRIRMLARTRPLQQWDLARELRRRIKRRFDREGIEIPFPQRTVWHREPERA